MKIGVILVSDKFSGGEKFVYEIIRHFNKKIKITLFVNKNICKYYENLKNIKIIKLNKLNTQNGLKYNLSLIKMKSQLKKYYNNFDLFFLNLEGAFRIFDFKRNKNFVPVLHGGEVNDFLNSSSLRYKLFAKPKIKKVLDKSKKLISVSHHQIKNLQEKYKKKTIVIPNGVDTKTFKPLKNIKQKKNVILFTGRFIDIKGIRELVNVAKQLPQYEFWFAGQGQLEKIINGKNIKNLGFKSTEELVKLYNQATICVFPSYREGFPLCGLEAMSCGKSVIVTSKGFSEYIENEKDGIIIPAKDEKALKEAIVRLMEDKKLRDKLGKNARKKALKYSWDKVVKRYLEVFEGVLNQK